DAESGWDKNETAHFVVHHQRMGFSPGDQSLIERIYSALHPDLWRLVPWMAEKRTDIYLYEDHARYLAGRFHPPAWSGGLLATGDGEPVLAVFEPLDASVVAHELTHLYFHSYFGDAQPPSWLNEGLAGMLQGEALSLPDSREKGPVLKAVIPLEAFLLGRPGKDSPDAWVSAWYRQAHSVVRFLKRGHIDMKFGDFCAALKDGDEVEAALKKIYEYEDLAAFEAAWNKWRPKTEFGAPRSLGD
ncbi:MAG: hypothetical protein HY925_13680, partial [Elusimicrobia bacterium]|nr:hypothetical protein [Elusimicrobiota bacterium]